MPRAKSIQIYLKPGIEEDDLLLELWKLCRARSRPQVVFRRMLREGLRAMIADGEMPASIAQRIVDLPEAAGLLHVQPRAAAPASRPAQAAVPVPGDLDDSRAPRSVEITPPNNHPAVPPTHPDDLSASKTEGLTEDLGAQTAPSLSDVNHWEEEESEVPLPEFQNAAARQEEAPAPRPEREGEGSDPKEGDGTESGAEGGGASRPNEANETAARSERPRRLQRIM